MDFIGCSQGMLLTKVDKCVITIFFFEENICLQERRTHLLVDGFVTMKTCKLKNKKYILIH